MSARTRRSARTLPAERLSRRIENRSAHLAVIGLGYVGLPLAVEFAQAGFRVTGIDIDERRVAAAVAPDAPTSRTCPPPMCASWHAPAGSTATTDFSVLKQVDTVNICVPTPLSKQRDPDVSYIVAAAEQVAKYLHPRHAGGPREHDLSRHHR